jgi:transposase
MTTMMPQPHDWREGRRLRAWELKQQGWSQREIAEALGVTEGAVSQWMKRAREGGGAEALRHRPLPGPQPKLSPAQLADLPQLLRRTAGYYGFCGEYWTGPRVATLIRRQFGVRYHPASVSRVLRRVGWTVQTPRKKASQRDEAAIARWYAEDWPALKKPPKQRGERSSGSTKLAST